MIIDRNKKLSGLVANAIVITVTVPTHEHMRLDVEHGQSDEKWKCDITVM